MNPIKMLRPFPDVAGCYSACNFDPRRHGTSRGAARRPHRGRRGSRSGAAAGTWSAGALRRQAGPPGNRFQSRRLHADHGRSRRSAQRRDGGLLIAAEAVASGGMIDAPPASRCGLSLAHETLPGDHGLVVGRSQLLRRRDGERAKCTSSRQASRVRPTVMTSRAMDIRPPRPILHDPPLIIRGQSEQHCREKPPPARCVSDFPDGAEHHDAAIGDRLLSPASAGRPPRGCGGAARWCAVASLLLRS
jgi:hypothetical protein